MKEFIRRSGILILIVAALLAAVLAVSSALMPAVPTLGGNILGVLSGPLRSGVAAFTGWAVGQYDRAANYDTLEAENERLREENEQLQAQAQEGQADSEENKRLREELNLRAKEKSFELEEADILSRSAISWASTLTLSKGAIHDVEAGDCVVDSLGNLVGMVDQVGLNWCSVRTVLDPELELGAMLSRTGGAAVAEGDFALMPEGKLKLTELPSGESLQQGDVVLTSGRGGLCPAGLVIGTVEADGTDEVILPAADLAGLSQVSIIKSFSIVE